MNEKKERKELLELIKNALLLNIQNCVFAKNIYKGNKKVIDVLNKSIRQSKKSLTKIYEIKHIEILRAIYGDCIGKVSGILMICGTEITSKQLQTWDKTEKGFKEFIALQEENKKIAEQKIKEQVESQRIIKKAQEEGKKVEMMYDPIAKKTRPVIVNEQNKA